MFIIKFSIIVPIYNVEKYLQRFFDCINNQVFESYELILVNDGSTDNSRLICEENLLYHSNWKLINQENHGSGFARNVGIDNAKGEYLLFFDPDDYIDGQFLDEILKNLLHQKIDLAIFGYYDIVEKKGITIKKYHQAIKNDKLITQKDFYLEFSQLFSDNMLYTLWNKVYSRRFLMKNKIRFSNSPMGQDTRFNFQVYYLVESVFLNRYSYYCYVTQRKGSSTSNFNLNKVKLKLEEFDIIQQFVFNRIGNELPLLKELYGKIIIDSINSIVRTRTSRKNFLILCTKIFAMIDFSKASSDKISIKILKLRNYTLYYIIKKIQYGLKDSFFFVRYYLALLSEI